MKEEETITKLSDDQNIISEAEISEIESSLNNENEFNLEPFGVLNLRNPQQVLTKKESMILLSKKEDELSEDEKIALRWLLMRLKFHRSTPKKNYTKDQNTLRRKKRKFAKQSRKANR
jgi:hypothetical protein